MAPIPQEPNTPPIPQESEHSRVIVHRSQAKTVTSSVAVKLSGFVYRFFAGFIAFYQILRVIGRRRHFSTAGMGFGGDFVLNYPGCLALGSVPTGRDRPV